MEERKTYQLIIDGDVNEYVMGRIAGIITGVTNSLIEHALRVKREAKGWWIFKRRKVKSVMYTFDATKSEAAEIEALVKYLYGKDEKLWNFGYGIKLIKEEA